MLRGLPPAEPVAPDAKHEELARLLQAILDEARATRIAICNVASAIERAEAAHKEPTK